MDELAVGDDEALDLLLPFASGRAVARHLARAEERGGPLFWGRLARHHPSPRRRCAEEPAGRPSWTA